MEIISAEVLPTEALPAEGLLGASWLLIALPLLPLLLWVHTTSSFFCRFSQQSAWCCYRIGKTNDDSVKKHLPTAIG